VLARSIRAPRPGAEDNRFAGESTTKGQAVTTTYASLSTPLPALRQQRPSRQWAEPASSRAISLAVVGLLHAVLVIGLVDALARRSVPPIPESLQVRIVEQPKAQQEELKPPPPKLDFAPPPFVPLPEVRIAVAQPAINAITTVTNVKEAAPPPPPPPAPVARVAPTLDTGRSADPVYPAISRRMGEEGVVNLLVLVGPDGSVLDVKVEKSSGYARLDQAALDGARTRCRFLAGTVDGKVAAMWYRYRYQFKLT
jgi:protein TonB